MRYYAIAQDKSAAEAEKLAAADIEALEKNLTTVRGLNLNRQYSIYQNQINKE